ncbi:MAG TPA: hypothetical protein VEL76_21955 [Gemmataceae bacterium]|nr:hypothetical protein [Gemmataceae bacterium]
MATLTDTPPEVERLWVEIWRQMSPERKWLKLAETFQTAKLLHAAGFRQRHPGASAADIHADWLAVQYGFHAAATMEEPAMEPVAQNVEILREVLGALTKLGIPYALGGSMASSIHGIARYTQDADVTVEPFSGKEAQLVALFGSDYYVSLPAVRQAVRDRSSFNILQTRAGFKIDVFVRKDTPFEEAALARRVQFSLPEQAGPPIDLLTAEDVILFKLHWYRLGNESSSQQWVDVLGVLKVQAGRLDEAHLDRFAAELGVGDLLARARKEAAG